MGLISLRCPSCGAEVVFSGKVIGRCPYCDSQLQFDDLVDKNEFEKLKAENYEYERQEANEQVYKKRMKSLKSVMTFAFAVLAVMTIIGFLLVLFGKPNAGVLLVLLALLGFIIIPPVGGANYPFFDDKKGVMVNGGAKRFLKIITFYGISIVVLTASMFSGAVIANAMGYESKSSKKSAAEAKDSTDDTDTLAEEWMYTNFSTDDDDLLHYYEWQCPGEVWEKDKDSKDTVLMIERQRAIAKNILEKHDVKVVKVEKLDEMNDAEIRGAEAYFDDRFDCSVTAVQGYEYHVQVEVRYSKDDDDTNRTDSAICVVKLKDDGWKVIPDSAGNLSYYEKSTK